MAVTEATKQRRTGTEVELGTESGAGAGAFIN